MGRGEPFVTLSVIGISAKLKLPAGEMLLGVADMYIYNSYFTSYLIFYVSP